MILKSQYLRVEKISRFYLLTLRSNLCQSTIQSVKYRLFEVYFLPFFLYYHEKNHTINRNCIEGMQKNKNLKHRGDCFKLSGQILKLHSFKIVFTFSHDWRVSKTRNLRKNAVNLWHEPTNKHNKGETKWNSERFLNKWLDLSKKLEMVYTRLNRMDW